MSVSGGQERSDGEALASLSGSGLAIALVGAQLL